MSLASVMKALYFYVVEFKLDFPRWFPGVIIFLFRYHVSLMQNYSSHCFQSILEHIRMESARCNY